MRRSIDSLFGRLALLVVAVLSRTMAPLMIFPFDPVLPAAMDA